MAPVARDVPRVGVVLAAGRSSRLHGITGGGSKALVRLGGLTLIERAVRTLLSAGVERVIVVVGYRAGTVATVVGRIGSDQVSTVYADNWEDGNGASLAAVRKAVQGEELFALITTDHVFGEEGLDALLHGKEPGVLVDPGPNKDAWSEGTRVRIRKDIAVAFGKKLRNPAIDCGAFILPPQIFECHQMAAANNDNTLAGALSRLAEIVKLKAVSIPSDSWWLDVDTPEDLRRARFLLRKSLTKHSDGPISRYLNRPISSRISMAIAPLRISPNLLSIIAFLAGLAGALMVAEGRGFIGAVLIHSASVLDGVDGEVARLSIRASPRGALFDGVLDRFADAAILAGLGVWSLTATIEPGRLIILTVAATTGALLSMATKDRVAAVGLMRAPERLIGFLMAGRDGRLFVVALGAVLALPVLALIVVAATSFVGLLLRMYFARPQTT
jgi:choline kinase/phosphatidylglycerophosphate synthase